MARQSQINQPSIAELKALYERKPAAFDPSKVTEQYATGMTLEDTIASKALQRQKAEEDLKKEIAAAKEMAAQQQRVEQFRQKPELTEVPKVFPKEFAESLLTQQKAQALGKDEDIRQRNYVRQLFTAPDGKNYAVLGKIDEKGKPIVVPVGDIQGENQPFIKPPLPAELVEKTGGYESLGLIAERIKSNVTDPKTGTMSEEAKGFLGALDAPATKLKAYTPLASGKGTNTLQLIQDLKNQIIYLRSGKQINEEEYKRLMGSMPSETRDESIFLSNLANFQKTFEDIKRERAEAFQQAGFRNVQFPGNQGAPQSTGNAGDQSQKALLWAQRNPADPRAKLIIQKLGMEGK